MNIRIIDFGWFNFGGCIF